MLISQKIAGFSKGESDNLCKALGKKKVAKIDEFLIFAAYAFNKSHAVSYTWISYCMGYLKTHHPHEF
jgi:DNA polymerase-3 subunit alpha